MHETGRSLIAALAVFVAVTCIDATVLYVTRDRLLGVNEDHFDKGVSLYETGSMLASGKPNVFRAPGYPVFVAAILELREAAMMAAQPLAGDLRPRGLRMIAVLAAHAALLGLLGAVVFRLTVARAGPLAAAACAVSVACNPPLLIIAGHVSYELLHLVLVTIATFLLLRRVGAGAPDGTAIFRNGLLWGAATLVKSVTLIAPAFIFLWALLHYGWRNAARTTAFFAAGLFLMVAPYTARNYVVTGRFIPVNAQAGFALWATSLEPIPPHTKYLHWVDMWFASAMQTYTEITGASQYSLVAFEDHVLELGDRFGLMARENLRRDPTVYVYNVLHNSVMFVVDPPASSFFERYAWPHDAWASRFAAGLSIDLMTVVSAFALVIGCVRRDPRWTVVLTLFGVMWAAHALTFLEPRYLYVKLPTIFVGFVFACAIVSTDSRAIWRRCAAGVAIVAALLSIAGLFAL